MPNFTDLVCVRACVCALPCLSMCFHACQDYNPKYLTKGQNSQMHAVDIASTILKLGYSSSMIPRTIIVVKFLLT